MMLSGIDQRKELDQETYKRKMNELNRKVNVLQQQILNLRIPVVITTEGWSAAGKGVAISKILYSLDPRYFSVYSMRRRDEEQMFRPYLWPYWTRTPAKGQITIFDRSWSRGLMPESIEKRQLSQTEVAGYYYDVNAFESQLSDDGAVILKFFLHISKAEQKKRFRALEKNPDTRWRIDAKDWEQNKKYDEHLRNFENMIRQTNHDENQWYVIESDDYRYAGVKILEIFVRRMEEEIEKRQSPAPSDNPTASEEIAIPTILSGIEMDRQIDDAEYKKRLKQAQSALAQMVFRLYAKRQSAAIVYEGWDAAGKGGNIKRITQDLDPRGYEVTPIAAPTQEELSHHYLWRFYTKLPKDGHIAIFDRSWYGRVLVERIEGFCTLREWKRAYQEINDMELHWHNHGIILLKFWINIDEAEQLRRFRARETDPVKQHKITDEDWRNREKWEAYQHAADEMLFRTSTDYAPWVIVESNDKKYARVKTIEHIAKVLGARLDGAGK